MTERWQRQRFWILLAVSGAVLTALSVGLGISFFSAKVEEGAQAVAERSRAPTDLSPAPSRALVFPPWSLSSSSPSASSRPSATQPEGLFERDIVAPLVAMRGDTAVVVTLFEAVRFFALTPSGLELVAMINIGFWPDFVALDGDTVVISTRKVRWLGPGEASQDNGAEKILPNKVDLGPGGVYWAIITMGVGAKEPSFCTISILCQIHGIPWAALSRILTAVSTLVAWCN